MVAHDFDIAEHPGAASLLARLEDTRTVEALHRLLDRADLLALAADSVDEVMRRGDTIVDSIGDTFKDVRKMAGSAEPFTDLAGQLPQLAVTGTKVAKLSNTAAFQNLLDSGLLEQLGNPATIERLHEIFGQLELVSFSLKMLDGFIRRGEELVDNITAAVADARKTGTGIAPDDLQVLKEQPKDCWARRNSFIRTTF